MSKSYKHSLEDMVKQYQNKWTGSPIDMTDDQIKEYMKAMKEWDVYTPTRQLIQQIKDQKSKHRREILEKAFTREELVEALLFLDDKL